MLNLEMDADLKELLWQQFGASIDMLENALRACPDELWNERERQPEFWYTVFHTLFFLDFYLSESRASFQPPAPFTLDELDPGGILPERVYTKDELQSYLEHGRSKCRSVIDGLTQEKAHERRVFGSLEVSLLELLLYNMRHVQHHAGQLNLILRQQVDAAPGWVSKAQTPVQL